MHPFSQRQIDCPYCGQAMDVTLDATNGSQTFYDDCSVCCNAVQFTMQVDELHDSIELHINADDEQLF